MAYCVKTVPVFVPEGRSEFSPGLQSSDGLAGERLSAGGTTDSVLYRRIRLLLKLVYTQSRQTVATSDPTYQLPCLIRLSCPPSSPASEGPSDSRLPTPDPRLK